MFGRNRTAILKHLLAFGPSVGWDIHQAAGMEIWAFYAAASRLERDKLISHEWVDRPGSKYRQQRFHLLQAPAGPKWPNIPVAVVDHRKHPLREIIEQAIRSSPAARAFDIGGIASDLSTDILAAITTTEGAGGPVNDPKYDFQFGRIINRASGESIPLDEPTFTFRARDVYAEAMLLHYLAIVKDTVHEDAVAARVHDFDAFKKANPDRMREPDTAPAGWNGHPEARP